MVCKWQVEIDDYANRVLAKHWPNVRRWPDVRTWPQPDTERVDVICGGFPCQDISYAGLGAGLSGERSGLFYESVRVVRQLRPRIVVLENVAALLTRGLDVVLGALAEIGYDAEWDCIPAAAVGAPHIRDRVFVIARLPNAESERLGKRRHRRTSGTGAGKENTAGVADAARELLNRSGLGAAKARRGESAIGCEDVPDPNGNGLQGQRISEASSGAFARRETTRSPATRITRSDWWDAEPDVGRVANGVPCRVDRLKGLGNAVVPQVAEHIGRRIVEVVAP
jgi:DNA (cytosine-5)-methyltransferase 1